MAAKKRKTAKKKANLEDLQNFTTGRLEDDAIEKVKRLEEVLGIKQVNPFGTNDPNIFEDKLKDFSSARFFNVPDNFDIAFKRMSSDGRFVEDSPDIHFRVHPSVCTGISVNYTPDGQYTSFKKISGGMIHVPAITLSLTFTELKLVTKTDIQQGY